MSIDQIFNEINQLYGLKSDEDILITELNNLFENIEFIINNNEDIDDNKILDESNEDFNDPKLQEIAQKQLEINKNLQSEINNASSFIQNPENAVKIANNPSAFIQSGKTSMSMVPSEMRDPNETVQNNQNQEKKSKFSIMGIFGIINAAIMKAGFVYGVTRSYNSGLAVSMLPMKLIKKGLRVGDKIGNLLSPKNLFSNKARLLNDRAFSLGTVDVEIGPKNIRTILKNAIQKNSEGEFANPSLLKSITTITGKKPEELSSIIGNKKEIGTLLKDKFYTTGYLYRNTELDITKSVDELGNTALKHTIKLPSVDGMAPDVSKYSEANVSILNVNKWRYVAIGVTIALILILLYRWLKKRNIKTKKEEYAEMNDISVNEITIPMLCEYFENESDFINTLEIIDEGLLSGIGSAIKSIFNLPDRLLKHIKSGIEAMTGISLIIEEGLKNKTMNPIMAKIYNLLIAIGKITLYISYAFIWVIAKPLKKLAGEEKKEKKENNNSLSKSNNNNKKENTNKEEKKT